MLYGAIEGGGTKFVCAIGDEHGQVLAETRFPTTTPAETLQAAIDFFQAETGQRGAALDAIGIASFGPVELNPASEHYGFITTTPKPGWAFADVVGAFKQSFPGVPVGFDTDVNGAALGEHRWGAAQAWDTFVYFTIGTGIGGGAMVEGRLLHGLLHPEMGHMILPTHPDDPLPRGVCPYHTACLEGLAAGPSLKERWGQPGETIPEDHKAWEVEAFYLAHAIVNVTAILSPQGVILGGSVPHQRQLFPLVRAKVKELCGGYFAHPVFETLEAYIVPPGLGDRAGITGAIALADAAARA